jgi:TIR domain
VAGVFISYRRDDTRPWAIALRDQLAQAFGERRVFFDVDSMNAGNWRAQIDQALERSAVVLVVIGPRWTTAADAEGHQRLLLPDDVHRMEVASALERPGITVIPVLVDGARLPAARDLPEDLRALLERQVSEIGDARDRRLADLRRLTRTIDGLIGQRRQRFSAAVAAVAIVAVGILNTLVRSNSPLVAIAFFAAAAALGACSWRIYRRMARDHVKGAWLALVAVVLSVATLAGSIVRLAGYLARPVEVSWRRSG